MDLVTVNVALSIAVGTLAVVAGLSGAVTDSYRRIRGRMTELERLAEDLERQAMAASNAVIEARRAADAAERSAQVAEERLEMQRVEHQKGERAELEIEFWNPGKAPPGTGLVVTNVGGGTATAIRAVRMMPNGKAYCSEALKVLIAGDRKSIHPWTDCEPPEGALSVDAGQHAAMVEWDSPDGERHTSPWRRVDSN